MLINHFHANPLPLVYKDKAERLQDSVHRIGSHPSPSETNPPTPLPARLSLEEFSAFIQEKRGQAIDARPEIFYRLGHVPGAFSLPRDDFENAYAILVGKLGPTRSLPMVIYCSDLSCEDSSLVKKSLSALGYQNLALFEGGWNAWTKAKKPQESTQ